MIPNNNHFYPEKKELSLSSSFRENHKNKIVEDFKRQKENTL